MKPYILLYHKHFNIGLGEYIKCEIPECGAVAQDIHHIERRGMGGTNKPENIENLMALCRYHHDLLGDRKQFKAYLKEIHLKKLNG
jgi:RNA processing factor Prp31